MRVCLFEDQPSRFEPLSLTRPVFDLLCGITSLADKHRQFFQAKQWGVWIRPGLIPLYRELNPGVPVNDPDWLAEGPLVMTNGRWLPGRTSFEPAVPHVAFHEGRPAYAVVAEGWQNEVDEKGLIALAERLPKREAGGQWVENVWNLVEFNGEQIGRDYPGWLRRHGSGLKETRLALVGPGDRLWISPSAKIDPYVVADTTQGPVVLAEGAVVTAFTRLEGPCFVGPGTQLMGAKIRGGTTLGPQCRIGGEVEASIVHGYSNKYHEGFLGHAYLGEWVNLGAGTHNSDLRNDYGEVHMIQDGQRIPTGLTKVGCFLGDHTKTGLGTLLNTGSSAGVFCNLLPAGRFAPKEIPSFMSWWNGQLREAFSLQQLLITAGQVMKRRGRSLTTVQEAYYRQLWDETDSARQRVLREQEIRQLRRSA